MPASFPGLAQRIGMERVAWPRPCRVGELNQSLPLLVLAGDAPAGFATCTYRDVRFVAGKDEVLPVLSLRHGVPDVYA